MDIKKIMQEISAAGLSDKASVHSYDEVYPFLFQQFLGKENNILEIGVAIGGGLKLLSEVFPESRIFGIDRSFSQLDQSILNETITLIQPCDQADTSGFLTIFPEIPKFDIIIEDASHDYGKSMESFEAFSPYMKVGGIYIIEDIFPQFYDLYKQDERFQIVDLKCVKDRQDDVIAIYRKI